MHPRRRSTPLLVAGLSALIAFASLFTLTACSSGDSRTQAGDKPKVAIILGGLSNDGGFNQYGADAVKKLEADGVIDGRIRESVASSADAEAAFRQFASEGYQLVIGWGLGFSDSIFTVAEELPGTNFLATGSSDILAKTTSNVETWTYASDQQGYLLGWVAGKSGLSPTAVVEGELAPFNEITYKAFSVGLAAANPAATELPPVFTGSWEDPTLANQAAKAQIAAGAELIVTGAEGYTSGVLSAAKAANIATIGASATSSSDAAAVNIGNVALDFTPTLSEAVDRIEDGRFGDHGYTSTIANKGLIFTDYNKVAAAPGLPDDLEAQIDQLAADLADGTVTIPPIG